MNILVTGGAKGIGKAIIEEVIKEKDVQILFTYNKSEKDAIYLKNKIENLRN